MRWSIPILLLPLLTGCQANYTILEHHDIVLPAGDKPTLVIEMVNGPIKVTTGSGKNIVGKITKRGVGFDKDEAEKELAAMDFEMKPEGDSKIRIKAYRRDKNRWGSSGVESDLEVPAGSSLELITSNGRILVEGKAGNVITKTSNGTVSIKKVQCPVVVTTSNGNVSAEDVAGTVKIDTSNGDIAIKGRQLTLACQTSNGSIKFAGDVTSGEHQLTTRNGSITATLPRDIQLTIDASTSNGRISSDFALAKTTKKDKRSLKGSIGCDDCDRTIVFKTSNGSVSLKKGKDKEFADVATE